MPDKPKPPPAEPEQLECAKCGCRDFRVTHTLRKNGLLRRRRRCRHCHRLLMTREIPESLYKQLSKPKEN